jgi:hypothetical protein
LTHDALPLFLEILPERLTLKQSMDRIFRMIDWLLSSVALLRKKLINDLEKSLSQKYREN